MRRLFSHVSVYLIMDCNILVTEKKSLQPSPRWLSCHKLCVSHLFCFLGCNFYCHRFYNRFLLYDVCCRWRDWCDTICRQDWSCFLVVCTIVKSCMVMLWLDRQCSLGTTWFNFKFLNFRSLNHNFFNFKFCFLQFQFQVSSFKLGLQFQKFLSNQSNLIPPFASGSTSLSNYEGQ